MKTSKIILPLLLIAALLAPSIASACSCAPPEPPLESMERVDAVFAGRAMDIDRPEGLIQSSTDPITVAFAVSEVWKGPEQAELTVQTAQSSASCGYNFEQGKEYLVYARSADGQLTTGLCSRTALLSGADEDLAELGEGMTPQKGDNPAPENAIFGWRESIAVGLLIVFIIAFAVLVKRKQK